MNNFILALVLLTNLNRSAAHLPVLKENTVLDSVAQARAEQLYDSGQFSHAGFIPALKASPYHFLSIGENLALGFTEPTSTPRTQQIETAFMKSPEHKANILTYWFKDIGVGTYGNVTVVEYGLTWEEARE